MDASQLSVILLGMFPLIRGSMQLSKHGGDRSRKLLYPGADGDHLVQPDTEKRVLRLSPQRSPSDFKETELE